MSEAPGAIRFERVSKRYAARTGADSVLALEDLDLDVGRGETVALVGPSGSGKTTALRMVNRLEAPDTGRVLVGGVDVAEREPTRLRRAIGYVLQEGGLFPHMTVERNVGLLCEREGWDAPRIEARVAELLELVRLAPEHAARFPHELSGGQRQRVGVARALALDPGTLLLDEPFGALDPITRDELQRELVALFAQLGKTTLLVTHDLNEAFLFAGRVALLVHGRLEQVGSEAELTERPATEFVERFVRARGVER